MEKNVMTNIKNEKNKFGIGFAIVELLVVIAIIGILATLTIVSYNGIQAKARDDSVLSDLDTMDALQTNYGLKNGLAGKAYYSGNGSDPALGFTPSSGNIIDVVTNSVDYCIRGYNTKGTKNSLNNSLIKESTLGICSTLGPSATAIADSPSSISVTGGTVTYSGGDTIRTFTGSGTLTVTGGTITGAQILVVGGGGGGGSFGGGGGGGLLTGSQNLSGTMGVTVGGGGAFGSATNKGTNGGPSIFGTLTALGGGGGGAFDNVNLNGVNGGSGGGAGTDGGGNGYTSGTAGLGTIGQGHDGGLAVNSATASGGGGGAGAVGGSGVTTTGGNGGAGTASSTSGSSVTYAGGGGASGQFGAGTGGSGGGGNGGINAGGIRTAGAANTGGGGGGGYATDGAAGGSGIVIIRYPTP